MIWSADSAPPLAMEEDDADGPSMVAEVLGAEGVPESKGVAESDGPSAPAAVRESEGAAESDAVPESDGCSWQGAAADKPRVNASTKTAETRMLAI
jgi:hypothetical protein